MLFSFLPVQAIEKALEHDTVGIFANPNARKGPAARYCYVFCQPRCSKRAQSRILPSFLRIQMLDGHRQQKTLEGTGLTGSENCKSYMLAVVSRSPRQGRPGPKIIANFTCWLWSARGLKRPRTVLERNLRCSCNS